MKKIILAAFLCQWCYSLAATTESEFFQVTVDLLVCLRNRDLALKKYHEYDAANNALNVFALDDWQNCNEKVEELREQGRKLQAKLTEEDAEKIINMARNEYKRRF